MAADLRVLSGYVTIGYQIFKDMPMVSSPVLGMSVLSGCLVRLMIVDQKRLAHCIIFIYKVIKNLIFSEKKSQIVLSGCLVRAHFHVRILAVCLFALCTQ